MKMIPQTHPQNSVESELKKREKTLIAERYSLSLSEIKSSESSQSSKSLGNFSVIIRPPFRAVLKKLLSIWYPLQNLLDFPTLQHTKFYFLFFQKFQNKRRLKCGKKEPLSNKRPQQHWSIVPIIHYSKKKQLAVLYIVAYKSKQQKYKIRQPKKKRQIKYQKNMDTIHLALDWKSVGLFMLLKIQTNWMRDFSSFSYYHKGKPKKINLKKLLNCITFDVTGTGTVQHAPNMSSNSSSLYHFLQHSSQTYSDSIQASSLRYVTVQLPKKKCPDYDKSEETSDNFFFKSSHFATVIFLCIICHFKKK
ncbi:hypothetical protein RFI_22558 [Reticulomyxa filosa]|uniref:Uncharacterized protein n=1 Tax=Reticulomyxa filosa TaxID=46433 RepID=X6MME2_RETFI|nr:hypothetical protein RFI_22558 [Reticulomyxa filosa]|eukprot:ETO14811.1 hypothetical protein RFI_22558 [Reticulomyxa filosa]